METRAAAATRKVSEMMLTVAPSRELASSQLLIDFRSLDLGERCCVFRELWKRIRSSCTTCSKAVYNLIHVQYS